MPRLEETTIKQTTWNTVMDITRSKINRVTTANCRFYAVNDRLRVLYRGEIVGDFTSDLKFHVSTGMQVSKSLVDAVAKSCAELDHLYYQ